MDARLVWDTWRRILTNDQLVERVLHPRASGAGEATGLSAEEMAILADYASTPAATDTNIGMYRRGLVRNALAALSLVPLTQRLLYVSGLDVKAVAADFVQSTGYVDEGPNFWRIAGGFVAYLARLPVFAARLQQDVLALDAAAVALARRLGESAAEVWPESAAIIFSEAGPRMGRESARFVASRAAVVVSSSYDITAWLENPEEFDANQELEPSTRHWLIYFPAADAAHAYAELSERAARAFNLLSAPKTAAEVSLALDGLPGAEVHKVIDSLAELGVIVSEGDHLSSRVKAALLHQGIWDLGSGESLQAAPRETGGAEIT
jgi:hypothetical protein